MIGWFITVWSLIGTVLNIKKKRICFYIWTITNAAWCIYDFYFGLYAQSGLFAVYTGLAIWGIFAWRE